MAALREARWEAEVGARAEDVLRLLDKRGVEVNEAQYELISTCQQLHLLDRWFDRAITAERIEDVLAEDPGA